MISGIHESEFSSGGLACKFELYFVSKREVKHFRYQHTVYSAQKVHLNAQPTSLQEIIRIEL